MAASSLIGNLAVSLTMNTAAFQRGATLAEKRAQQMQGRMAAVGSSVKGIGVALGAGLALTGFSSVVSGAFEMASALSEAAEKAGVTVEALQELRFAAQQTGVAQESMDASLSRLTRTLGDLQLGTPAAVKAFDALGLSAEKLKGMPTGEAFRLIAQRLAEVPDPATRAAMAVDIFGRSGQALMPILNGGAEAIDKFAEASRKNGQISTEDAQKLDELADSWDKLKTKVGVATANLIASVSRWVEKWDAGAAAVSAWADRVDAAIIDMAKNVGMAIGNMVRSINDWIIGKLTAIWDAMLAKIEAVKRAFKSLGGLMGASFDGMGASFQRMSYELADGADFAAGAVSSSFADMADNVLGAFSRMAGSIKSGGFLDILGSVLGLGLQLGGLGMFGKGIAANINGTAGGGFVKPSGGGGGGRGGGGTSIEVVPSPYFDVRVASISGSTASRAISGNNSQIARSSKFRLG